jgi:hypothetical protein
MSTERISKITCELLWLASELKTLTAKILPLVKELEELGIPLPPEIQAMFLALKPNNKQLDIYAV